MKQAIFLHSVVMLVALLIAPPVRAQVEPTAFRPEVLPAPYVERIDRLEEAIRIAAKRDPQVQGQWISLRRWRRGDIIRVCFLSGPRSAQRIVASVAAQWNDANAGVSLDFGAPGSLRFCDPAATSEVRVGFNSRAHPGDWSLVGRESIDRAIVGPMDASMNLDLLPDRPIHGRAFQAVVLHEFGHALGLLHEHQHPLSTCESELNLEYVYALLQRHPYLWSVKDIDFNIRRGGHFSGTPTSRFDPSSIMLYSFPPGFYRRGESSICYNPQNYEIADGDYRALRFVYGSQGVTLTTARDLLSAVLATALTPRQRGLIIETIAANAVSTEERMAAFRSPQRSGQSQVQRGIE